MELLQDTNEVEELHECYCMSLACGKEIRLHKGKGAQVAERLVCGKDNHQADLCGSPQGFLSVHTSIKMFLQEGDVWPI